MPLTRWRPRTDSKRNTNPHEVRTDAIRKIRQDDHTRAVKLDPKGVAAYWRNRSKVWSRTK